MANDLRVLHVVASLNADVGGPARSVSGLAAGLAGLGVPTTIATLDYSNHGRQMDAGEAEVLSWPANFFTRALRGMNRPMGKALPKLAGTAHTVVHSHGLWMMPNLYAHRAARIVGAPHVISPRGMLDRWARGRSRIRKAVVAQLWQERALREAAMLHATSPEEAEGFREIGLRNPVAVLPNGISPPPEAAPDRSTLEVAFPALAGKRWALFMSRIHPKKGIAELANAWLALERQVRSGGWHLILAGSDIENHGAKMLERLRPMADTVTVTGMLEGRMKDCALHHSDFLVLPTFSENFGLVIAEALAAGTPVLTTRMAPWSLISAEACGWWTEATPGAIQAALRDALGTSPEAMRQMGVRGRATVRDQFDWQPIASRMRDAYLWVLGSGSRPDFVIT